MSMEGYTSGEILHCGRKRYLVEHFLSDGHDPVLGIVDDLTAHSTGRFSEMNCPRTHCVAPPPAPARQEMIKESVERQAYLQVQRDALPPRALPLPRAAQLALWRPNTRASTRCLLAGEGGRLCQAQRLCG